MRPTVCIFVNLSFWDAPLSVLFFLAFFILLNLVTFIASLICVLGFDDEYMATFATVGQSIGEIVGILSTMFIYKKTTKKAVAPLEINPIKPLSVVLAVILGVACNTLLRSGITLLPVSEAVQQQMLDQQLEAMNLIITAPYFLVILLVGILAPIAEEIALRGGVLQNMRRDSNVWLGIILSGAFFSLMHITGGPRQMLYTFVHGLIWGLLCHVTKSILPAIIAHVFNNGWLFLLPVEAVLKVTDFCQSNYAWAVFLVSIAIITACVWLMSRLEKDREWKVLLPGKAQPDPQEQPLSDPDISALDSSLTV